MVDDAFGAFASPTIPAITQINVPGTSTSPKSDDDDWGDFVVSPLRSNLPDKTSIWVKPAGALPLSLFGENERDDDVADGKRSSEAEPAESQVKGENGFNFKSNISGIGSDLNENKLNFGLFGAKNDDHNFNGLGSDSYLFPGLEKGNLGGLSSSIDMFSVNNVAHSPQVKDLSGLSSNKDLFPINNRAQSTQVKDLSGLRSSIDLFSINNGAQSPQVKDLSGLSSNIDLFSINNETQSPQVKDVSGLSFDPLLLTVKNGDPSHRVKNTIAANSNSDAFSHIKDGHLRVEAVNELKFGMDSFTGNNGNNLVGLHSNLNHSIENKEIDDDDDDSWEFKDAYSELKVDERDNNKVNTKQQESSDTTGIPSIADNGSHRAIDFSLASNGNSVKPIEMGFSFDFTKLAVAQNGFVTAAQNGPASDSFFNSEQSGFDGGSGSDREDSNEWFGDFQGAFTGTGLKEEDVPNSDASHSEVELLTSNGKVKENETRSNNHHGAIPLSLFGDEELETDDSSNAQDDFAYKPSSTRTSGINNEGSNYSIHDVISNLYSQAQQNPLVKNPEILAGNGLHLNPSDEVLSHIPENLDEDFDDDSWEFKDASVRTRTLELNSHLDFYTELKEELSFICRCHLDNLKKARDTAAVSGDDAKVFAIEEEIQEACKELQEENTNFEIHSDNRKNREISLDEFLEVLHEPKFQVLESKYQLSRKLNLAQKDLTSAIEAMKHTKSKLNILKIGSLEDQYNYVSTWCKIISVCAQELKHGALIWKQSVEKNIQNRMVSEPRGKNFIISLAEIYRAVTILGASAKLYEPWILSNYINSTGTHSLLEDCYTIWSCSRIGEALEALPVNDEYHNKAKALLESIKRLLEFDELKLQDLVFNQQVSTCRLSLLSSKVIPEMKMAMWHGEPYFVTLANLWLNLVSCDCPELPHLQVAS